MSGDLTRVERAAILRRMLPASAMEIRAAWCHVWDGTKGGERKLYRDLHGMGARRDRDGQWTTGCIHGRRGLWASATPFIVGALVR